MRFLASKVARGMEVAGTLPESISESNKILGICWVFFVLWDKVCSRVTQRLDWQMFINALWGKRSVRIFLPCDSWLVSSFIILVLHLLSSIVLCQSNTSTKGNLIKCSSDLLIDRSICYVDWCSNILCSSQMPDCKLNWHG